MELSDEIMKEVKRYDDGNGCTRQQLVDSILILVSQQCSRVSASPAAPVLDRSLYSARDAAREWLTLTGRGLGEHEFEQGVSQLAGIISRYFPEP